VRFKLDEMLGTRAAGLFREAGHDAVTVAEEGLTASTDRGLIDTCRDEGRCLVSLDMDFGNPLRFRPRDYAGIAVLRLPSRLTPGHVRILVTTLIRGLARDSIEGNLWIVEPGRIRKYLEAENDAPRR